MTIIDKYLESIGKDRNFLKPKLDEEFGVSIKGISDGVELIKKHIEKNSTILIYGDYDVDGTTGSIVLDLMFRTLGYDNFKVLLNERVLGNGFNQATIDTIMVNKPIGLVISTDHGSSSDNYIHRLIEMGIDVLITDHHQLKDGKPLKYANVFINPQQDESDKYKKLSGCAVSYALVKQVLKNHPNEKLYENEMLELVGISTIGDMMDMSNEINRAITIDGIKSLNSSKLGKAYRKLMNYPKNISSKDIGWTIVPMVNSCSRMASAQIGYISLLPIKLTPKNISPVVDLNNLTRRSETSMLSTGNSNRYDGYNEDALVDIMATTLDQMKILNLQRKRKQNEILNDVRKQIKKDDLFIMIVINEGNGINGIISSQIGNDTKKPTITFVYGKDTCSGSCRGIVSSLDVKACFDYIKDKDSSVIYMEDGVYKYGGHHGAAGITVNTNKLSRFKELFNEYIIDNNIKHEEPDLLNDPTVIDITKFNNITKQLEELEELEPFGNNLKPPMLKVKFDLIKNLKTIPLGDKKLIKFSGVINDATIDCSLFAGREDDIEVRDAYIIGNMTYNKGPIFDIVKIIQ